MATIELSGVITYDTLEGESSRGGGYVRGIITCKLVTTSNILHISSVAVSVVFQLQQEIYTVESKEEGRVEISLCTN